MTTTLIPAAPAVRAPAASPAASPAATGAVAGGVRRWLRAEGLAALATAVALYAGTGRGWAAFALLFFAPDLCMAAYLVGPRVGAAAYNALHSYVGPLALGLIAHAAGQPALIPLGLIWAAHIGFDRLIGYGLKYPTGFGDTHLGTKGPRA